MDWFYEKNGTRQGPVTIETLRQVYDRGEIFLSTLVWNGSFGTEWRPLSSAAVLEEKSIQPPPLPKSSINGIYAWIYALVPLIGLAVQKVIEAQTSGIDSNVLPLLLLGYGVSYAVLGYLDARQIELSGRSNDFTVLNRDFLALNWLLVVAPAYLFQRARALREKQLLLGVWIAAFIGSIFIQDPLILKNGVYLGVGIPSCDTSVSLNQVKNVFDQIPLVVSQGQKAVSVTDPVEIAKDDKSRTCVANVQTVAGSTVRVQYRISEQGNEYYYEVRIR